MDNKGQGALEFLMTYGWAFLVILIMIGALAYFGILNPSRFLPDRCDFGTQIQCSRDQFKINSSDADTMYATVTNNLGASIRTHSWTVTTDVVGLNCNNVWLDNATDTLPCASPGCVDLDASNNYIWKAGQSKRLVVDCTGGANLAKGDKVKLVFEYKYYSTSAGSDYTKTGGGEVYAAVQ